MFLAGYIHGIAAYWRLSQVKSQREGKKRDSEDAWAKALALAKQGKEAAEQAAQHVLQWVDSGVTEGIPVPETSWEAVAMTGNRGAQSAVDLIQES